MAADRRRSYEELAALVGWQAEQIELLRAEIVELCAHVHAVNEAAAESEKVAWPPILRLFTSVVVTLTYLRRNRIQAEIGESFGVS